MERPWRNEIDEPLESGRAATARSDLGRLFIAANALFVVLGVFEFVLLAGIGAATGDRQAIAILSLVGTAVGLLLIALSIPGIVAGYGLLARKVWGCALGIVVGK